MLLALLAAEDGGGTLLLGDNLLPLLVLAIGGAMAVGTLLALVRPRPEPEPDDEAGRESADDDPRSNDPRANDLDRPPLGRSLLFMGIGLVGVLWATATLLS